MTSSSSSYPKPSSAWPWAKGSELLLISGEAGAGKTTVAGSDFARFADKQRAYVLFGHCEEELRAPYQLFREALHHLVVHAPAELLESHVQSHGGEVVRLAPAVGQRVAELPSPQSTDPDTERYLLFGSVLSLFAQVSLGQPLVVVFDDLQWSDGPSLNLLRHIAANAGPMRLMVVGTYRGSRLSGSDPRWKRWPRCDVNVALPGSSCGASMTLACSTSWRQWPDTALTATGWTSPTSSIGR